MSGLTERMRSTILLKSRVGFRMLDDLFHLEAVLGQRLDSSAAVPAPNSESSCTIITVRAGLPAAWFSAARS